MIDDGLVPCPRREAWRRLGARWPLVAYGAASANKGSAAAAGTPASAAAYYDDETDGVICGRCAEKYCPAP